MSIFDDDEEAYQAAVTAIRSAGKASTSFVQRSLQIGYNRAACLMEKLEQNGVITKPDREGRRAVL